MTQLTRAERERSFIEAEASLRLEGLEPTPFYHGVKARVLAGEITTDEAKALIVEHHRRRKIFRRARLLVESEGLKVPAHVLVQGERYIVGEITIDEALKLKTDEHGFLVVKAAGPPVTSEMVKAALEDSLDD